MKSQVPYCFVFFILLLMGGCNSNPEFDKIPEIEFIGFSKDTLVQGSLFSDSLFLQVKFKDGDGDLGTGESGIFQNVVLIDKRTNDRLDQYKIPDLPIGGGQTGIEGTITMKVYTTCCLFPEDIPPCLNPEQYPTDELVLTVQLIDDSGNESNIIETSLITLLCQ